jgi:hypothetical protein
MKKHQLLAMAASSVLAACERPNSCVARGTRIRTPSGERPVEALAVGDLVLVVNPSTGETVTSALVAIVSAQREVGAITFGNRSLQVTSDHPLFDPDTGSFHDAGDWLLGTRRRLLCADGARVEPVVVTATQAFVGVTTVFDLTVEHAWHTFVANDVVVHNKIFLNCKNTDGGVVMIRTSCECPGGGRGEVLCTGPRELATCENCQDLPDGGVP